MGACGFRLIPDDPERREHMRNSWFAPMSEPEVIASLPVTISEDSWDDYLEYFFEKRDLSQTSTGDLRIGFVGQDLYFRVASFEGRLPRLESRFFAYTPGADWRHLQSEILNYSPDIIVVFRPDFMPKEFLEFLRKHAIVVGYLTEPLPFHGWEGHPDLLRRYELIKVYDPSLCDFHIAYSPYQLQALGERVTTLMVHPLPINDKTLLWGNSVGRRSLDSGVFLGRVTPYREVFLGPLKHNFDWTVLDHGYLPQLSSFGIGLNLHNEDYPNFENRVLCHLALGQLVLSQPLDPRFDLRPGSHYLEFTNVDELMSLIYSLRVNQEVFWEVARKGNEVAKQYAASAFLARLISQAAEADA